MNYYYLSIMKKTIEHYKSFILLLVCCVTFLVLIYNAGNINQNLVVLFFKYLWKL